MDESRLSAEEDFSQRVWSVLKGATSSICTGGLLELDGPPTITLKSGEIFTIEGPGRSNQEHRIWGEELENAKTTRQAEKLQGLLGKIPQAAFGQGQETVYNKDVRDALQLPAQDFEN